MSDKCYVCGGTTKIIKDKPYEYKECGLDNILIIGINQFECKKCNEFFVSIPKVEELHQAIGRGLCCKKSLLTKKEIKYLRKELHMKAKNLANALGVTAETLSRWENGRTHISEAQDRLLRTFYMMYASEHAEKVLHQDVVKFFSDMPLSRKELQRIPKMKFTPADWMGPQLNFCTS
jgi:putative zinc finger/helix-turn-helix YgiT family protein